MTQWVTDQNIADFKEKLARETDPEKRRILADLLAREEARRRQLAEEPQRR